MLFDTHAHMNDPCFDEDREEVLLGLKDKGVEFMMNVGCCRASSYDCVAMAEKYPFVYASVGTHPDEAQEVNEEVLAEYRKLAANPRVRAIGEIGLDYYYENVPRERKTGQFPLPGLGFSVPFLTPQSGKPNPPPANPPHTEKWHLPASSESHRQPF